MNGPLEVVFSFDTTGSMYSCLEQVRGRIQDMIQRLQSDIPGIRMAVFAHGDYCDAHTYVTKWIDFTTDVAMLCHFVQTVERTGGGDSPECYELVLHQVRTKLSWTPTSRRGLVMIGDDEPHEANFPGNKDMIDWKVETKELALHGVTIYGVQCGTNHRASNFYKTISMVTNGKHLQLDDFGNLFDVLMAVCYREGNDTAMLASYEKEVRARCGDAGIGKDIDAIFASLRNDGEGDSGVSDCESRSSTSSSGSKTKYTLAKSPSIKTKPARPTHTKSTSALKVRKHRKLSAPPLTKMSKDLSRFHAKNLPLLRRENVPETNFKLNALKWSKWMWVLSPDQPTNQSQVWVKRRGSTGYRLNIIKPEVNITNDQRKVLFEVAVKTPGSGRLRHVVHSSFSTRCLNNNRWERCLIRVRRQIERVLKDGCQIYLRYCFVGKASDPSSLVHGLRRYDYAWKKQRHVRSYARDVTKGKYAISVS